jgi:perosamine synthetase
MTLILEAMRDTAGDSTRNEVVIPAYTCYSVPAAIQRAGLLPRLCDVDPATLGIDLEKLDRHDFSRTLAVVSSNLYGLPNDLSAIQAVCLRERVYFLDDAAQALGSTVNGQAVGSFGDAGLYSFDKGKVISTMQGGAIVAPHSCLTGAIDASVHRLQGSTLPATTTIMLSMLIYSIFLRPSMYGLAQRVPFAGLGQTRYEPVFPITTLSAFQSGVAARLLPKVERFNSDRRRHAAEYTSLLHGVAGITLPRLVPGARAAYTRYPLRVSNASARYQALRSLNRSGIGATASYPRALADVLEVASTVPKKDLDCPGAREVAATIVTLPTHAYCTRDLPAMVREILVSCLE